MQDPIYRDDSKDYPNWDGKYMRSCSICKETFLGHKRRTVCIACSKRGSRDTQEQLPKHTTSYPFHSTTCRCDTCEQIRKDAIDDKLEDKE